MVVDPTVPLRQRGLDLLARRVVSAVALGDGPLHDRSDALADLLRRRRLGVPDRSEHGQHVVEPIAHRVPVGAVAGVVAPVAVLAAAERIGDELPAFVHPLVHRLLRESSRREEDADTTPANENAIEIAGASRRGRIQELAKP